MDTTTTTLTSRGAQEPGGASRLDDHSQPVVDASAGFHFYEASLVSVLGQPLRVIRAARQKLREGADWSRDGNQVRYSAVGVEALKAAFGLDSAQKTAAPGAGCPPDAPESKNPPATPPTTKNPPTGLPAWQAARVARVFQNPKLCQVKLADGTLLTARISPEWGPACLNARIEVRPEAFGRENQFWIAKKPAQWRA